MTVCSEDGESPGAPRAAPHAVLPAAASGDGPGQSAGDDVGGGTEVGADDVVVLRSVPAEVALAALAVFGLGVALAAAGASAREPDLGPREVVLFRGRPRRSFWRFVFSLGLYTWTVRSTRFVLTQKRLIVQHGILRREVHSVPLSAIAGVDVVAGLWEGTVRVAGRSGGGAPSTEVGPLSAKTAQSLASTITQAISSAKR